ncbi:dioxygenase family protein [Mycolicibacterium senegalense]|uniref:dioxygenase family protein n=1 Tax=Mycolicibacterium senegalense TaxID=1796 RepID=UPI0021F30A3A|nr:dioxygenase [Mycolicibacterium senegalense]
MTEDNITDLAVKRWATGNSRRLAEIMTGVVRHLHEFTREVCLTEDEWMAAIEWITAIGKISDEKRQEVILASDVLGLSMLVVQLNNRFTSAATPATVLGPFYIDDSPTAPYGYDMSEGIAGIPAVFTGKVTDPDGKAIPNAVLDVWQADGDGAYESQISDIDEARLRAKYRTREDGTYCIRTIAPRGYTIPMDGPVGSLIEKTDISPYRPAHIHFLFEEPGYEKLITHLFQEGAEYLDSDVVFGVKDGLIVRFVERAAGPAPDGTTIDGPFFAVEYDFVLQPSAR